MLSQRQTIQNTNPHFFSPSINTSLNYIIRVIQREDIDRAAECMLQVCYHDPKNQLALDLELTETSFDDFKHIFFSFIKSVFENLFSEDGGPGVICIDETCGEVVGYFVTEIFGEFSLTSNPFGNNVSVPSELNELERISQIMNRRAVDLIPELLNEKTLYLFSMGLLPKYQNKGIEKLLLNKILDLANEEGFYFAIGDSTTARSEFLLSQMQKGQKISHISFHEDNEEKELEEDEEIWLLFYDFKHSVEERMVKEELFKFKNDVFEPHASRVTIYPLPIIEEKDSVYYDQSGRQLLDVFSAAATVAFGNSEVYQKILTRMYDVARLKPNITPYFKSFEVTYYKYELAKLMADIDPTAIHPAAQDLEDMKSDTPDDMYITSLGLSGSDSVEAAVKMALCYRTSMGVSNEETYILSFNNAYHGQTGYSNDATSFGRNEAPSGNEYLPFPTTHEEGDALIAQLEEKIRSGQRKYSVILLEIIQGDAGIHIAPPGFYKKLFEFCQKHHIITIADEVQMGFGRTGKMFSFEHEEDIIPDLVVIGKAYGAGLYPISAVIGKAKIINKMPKPGHVFSYSSNPAGCAAATEALRILKEEKRPSIHDGRLISYFDSNAEIGEHLIEELTLLQNHYPDIIKEIRGIGLAIGVECQTKMQSKICHQRAIEKGVMFGLFGQYNHVLRIEPHYTINNNEINLILTTLSEIFKEIKNHEISQELIDKVSTIVGIGEESVSECSFSP
ncbi:MAG: aminotransferase class III-fold pyridoxal phosphate-dependent enzyme [Gammaproteobacteria bacterium]